MFTELLEKIDSTTFLDDKKKAWYNTRTSYHIQLVQAAAARIVSVYPEFVELLMNVEQHDASKFEEPELSPYIELTWLKKNGEGDNPDVNSPEINKATLHHIKYNAHHPEYHLENDADANISADNRDESDKCVDASLMDDLSLVEMVCDWQAMSEELGINTARQWFNKTRDVRWHFSDIQVELIDMLLEVFE